METKRIEFVNFGIFLKNNIADTATGAVKIAAIGAGSYSHF